MDERIDSLCYETLPDETAEQAFRRAACAEITRLRLALVEAMARVDQLVADTEGAALTCERAPSSTREQALTARVAAMTWRAAGARIRTKFRT